MPEPTVGILLGFQAGVNKHTPVTFRNLTRGGVVKATMSAKGGTGEAVSIQAPATWVNGDVVRVEIMGKYDYGASVTISKGSGAVKFSGSLSEETDTVAVEL
jgi:nitrous oxidase accessory protein NosD